MNRLQKKCVIATAGFHLLLLVILFVGPAFFNSEPKTDDSQVLDVIPANLIDAAFNSGVKNATPPAPTPIVTPPQPSRAKTSRPTCARAGSDIDGTIGKFFQIRTGQTSTEQAENQFAAHDAHRAEKSHTRQFAKAGARD